MERTVTAGDLNGRAALGGQLGVAGGMLVAWTVVPHARGGAVLVGLAATAALLLLAGALLWRSRDRPGGPRTQALLVATHVLLALAVAFGGTPGLGVLYFLVLPWIAYSCTARVVVAHVSVVSALYLCALVSLALRGALVPGEVAGQWLLRVVPLVSVAVLVHGLAGQVRRHAGRLVNAYLRAPQAMGFIDGGGGWTEVNRAAASLLGRSEAGLRGRRVAEDVHPDDVDALAAALAGDSGHAVVRLQTGTGSRWVDLDVSPVPTEEGVRFLQAKDITREQEAAGALVSAERRTRAIVATAADAIVLIDERGVVESFNPAAERMFGYSSAEVIGSNVSVLMPRPQREEHDGYLSRYRATGEAHIIGIGREVVGRRADGSQFPIDLAISQFEVESGRRYAGVMRDITASKALQKRLQHQATHDPLTGLPNRLLLLDRLGVVLPRSTPRSRTALLFLDLSGFKTVNDSLGHPAGDEVLRAVGGRLASVARRSETEDRTPDTVGRLGGDEFVVIVEGVSSREDVEVLTRRILDSLSSPFVVGAGQVFLSASVGIAMAEGPVDAEELLRDADAAMYRAKAAGPGSWTFFDEDLRLEVVERLDVVTGVHLALERDELVLHFQPEVDLHDGAIRGVEALLRWQHPERGLLPPGTFLAHAEAGGLATALGDRVLAGACRQAVSWSASLPDAPRVWVNLSGHELDDSLADRVRRAMTEAGCPARLLGLEVTETALMRDPAAAQVALSDLRRTGVRVMVDDFGTGYSSLAYLHQLPLDGVKIDRRFVQALGEDEGSRAVVRAILMLAAALDLTTVAEGLETPEQRDALVALGCGQAQGYLLGRPLPAEGMTAVLTDRAAHRPPASPVPVPPPEALVDGRGRQVTRADQDGFRRA